MLFPQIWLVSAQKRCGHLYKILMKLCEPLSRETDLFNFSDFFDIPDLPDLPDLHLSHNIYSCCILRSVTAPVSWISLTFSRRATPEITRNGNVTVSRREISTAVPVSIPQKFPQTLKNEIKIQ